jgi:hypothetical protein
VQGFRAVLDAMAGRFAPARERLARSRSGLEELGMQQASVWMAVYAAMADVLAGDLEAAERALDDAERIALAIGDRWFASTILVDRAHVLLAQGSPAAAAAAVERIESTPVPTSSGGSSATPLAPSSPRDRVMPPTPSPRPAARRLWPTAPRCIPSGPMPTATSPTSLGARATARWR